MMVIMVVVVAMCLDVATWADAVGVGAGKGLADDFKALSFSCYR